MGSKKVKAATAAVAMALGVLSSPSADSAIFVKIKGIEGDVTTEGYKDWIDVLSWSWGVSGEVRNKPRARPRNCVRELEIVKTIDAATAGLITNAVIGERIEEVTLAIVDSGGEDKQPIEYLTLKLRNVQVSSWHTSGDADDRPTEEVTFNFQEVKGEYTAHDDSGSVAGVHPFDVGASGGKCK